MLFKGTERFPKGQIDRLAFVAAGQSNAETGEDCTHYWFAFPSDRWELALAVEADRMRGATFDPREVEAERHVIVEERARDLDSPVRPARPDPPGAPATSATPTATRSSAGPTTWRGSTSTTSQSFYRTHYRPDGAVLVVVGDVDPSRALDRIEAHFGGARRRATTPGPTPTVDEPRQIGRRDFALIEPESVARGLLGWHTVAARASPTARRSTSSPTC